MFSISSPCVYSKLKTDHRTGNDLFVPISAQLHVKKKAVTWHSCEHNIPNVLWEILPALIHIGPVKKV